MPIIKYLKLPFEFDVVSLQREVAALTRKPWHLHYQTLHYTGEWTALPLRSIEGKTDNIIISPTAARYLDTVFLNECPYMASALDQFKCTLQAVRLLKLNAGSEIKQHKDAGLNFENGEIRLHIPVITHPGVEFMLDNEQMRLQEGECWYMNFNLSHSINNRSHVDRIHLVIDALVNDWVKEIFYSPDITVKKEIEDPSTQYDPETKKQMIAMLREMNTEVSNSLADNLEKQILPST